MGHLATKTFYCLNMEDIDQSSSKKEPSVPHVPGPNAIDVTPDKDGGVLKDVKHEGVGDELPPLGSNVSVHYVGTLLDGSKFDSSRDRGEKFEISLIGRHGDKIFDQREVSFNLGDGLEHNIPDGVEQALLKFKKNERSILQLKPDYGFGSAGSQELTIPANASLEYEVELKNFEKAKEYFFR